ncbi:hypothetical protein ABB37_05237 [Leptomonas pyrrhocoris]|uniref:Uncharacterized protein n=1 Tax=Leptomonas pyrrhocoris TaxID=157538 RepID=A0A0M9FZP1_LEPPY|nr:hypothetical protein ABB37_05237 [Leptomonas pyrrhocoris]XP_015657824.1 hypothetical protein ABB37_05237 [Leptomonas pyrrhocoris]KPA79384.1 hypothetical protein ABB37_05237 [Leptomonas pyrrhocoris]KPA79385.1 hypothetical protein ABB37_05237 [Leptomonas pyrrhocoris]|eukprot:XP_015657823.1 hypothetical protein ABB37_05237 [Leptomonas pyrrhocoris]
MEIASNFCLLHAKLSKLGFSDWASVNEGDVMTGSPHTFAVFLRFLYRRFPAATATLLRRYDWFLVEADDAKVGASTLRLLSTAAHETNLISAAQFGQCKYAMIKINMCHSLLRLLRSLRATSSAPVATGCLTYQGLKAAATREEIAPYCSPSRTPNGRLRINERRSELNSVSRS